MDRFAPGTRSKMRPQIAHALILQDFSANTARPQFEFCVIGFYQFGRLRIFPFHAPSAFSATFFSTSASPEFSLPPPPNHGSDLYTPFASSTPTSYSPSYFPPPPSPPPPPLCRQRVPNSSLLISFAPPPPPPPPPSSTVCSMVTRRNGAKLTTGLSRPSSENGQKPTIFHSEHSRSTVSIRTACTR